MKRKSLLLILAFAGLFLIYFNQMIKLEYDVNLPQYLSLSMPLSDEEKQRRRDQTPLIYGGNISEPPLGIYYPENGQHVGLVVDYISAISIEMGTPILSKPMVWNDALEALSQGETDLCDMIPSPERGKKFDFSNPLYDLRGLVVIDKKMTQIKTIDDLRGRKIAAQKGDYAIDVMRQRFPDSRFIETKNASDALGLLEKGEVDAVIGDEPVIWYLIKEFSVLDQYQIIDEPLYDAKCVIAVPKGEKELLKAINRSILKLRQNGTLEKINEKWSGFSPLLNKDRDNQKLKVGLLTLVCFLGTLISMAYYGNMKLRSMVTSKTNELQFTFDSLSSFIVVLGDDHQIVNANLAFFDFVGEERSQALNKRAEDYPILLAALSEPVFTYKGKIYEVKSQNHQILMISDVTYEKIKEQKMIHVNRMEAIGQLASGVAHELRNPLGVIRNSTYLLHDLSAQDTDVQQKAIGAIDRAIDRAGKIIDNLLNFSRMDQTQVTTVLVKPLVEEILEYYKVSNKEKRITFSLECQENLQLTTYEGSLRHVLINLICNGCDAIKDQGTLRVTCGILDDERITIEVMDTGMGIKEEDLEKLFDPFFTTKPPGEGTGLGLYIVYTELLKMNGEIKVESRPSQFTTFTMTLPRRLS